MAGPNTSFCFLHTPHIAGQLKALPRTSRDRRVIEAQIEALSRESLVAADKVLGMLRNRGNALRRDERHRRREEE